MGCKVAKKYIEIEKEHTKSDSQARKIACDHIKEFGPRYYPELMKLEKKLKGGAK